MNKNNILLLSLFLLSAFSEVVLSQDILNHEKYWYYRFRFLGNETAEQPGFIFIGDEPGASIYVTIKNTKIVFDSDV